MKSIKLPYPHPQRQLSLPSAEIGFLSTKLPSVVAMQKYGVKPSELKYVMDNMWKIEDEKLLTSLWKYYKLYWSCDWFKEQLSDGTIERDGRTYCIIYKGITPTQISKYDGQLVLSFRVPQIEFNLYPVVLVAPAKKERTQVEVDYSEGENDV